MADEYDALKKELDALKKELGAEDRYYAISRMVHDFYYDGLELVAPDWPIPEDAMTSQEAMFFAFAQWLETRSTDDIKMSKGLTLAQFVKLLKAFPYLEYRNGVFMRLKPKPPLTNPDVIYSPIDSDATDILVILRPKKG